MSLNPRVTNELNVRVSGNRWVKILHFVVLLTMLVAVPCVNAQEVVNLNKWKTTRNSTAFPFKMVSPKLLSRPSYRTAGGSYGLAQRMG